MEEGVHLLLVLVYEENIESEFEINVLQYEKYQPKKIILYNHRYARLVTVLEQVQIWGWD